MINHRKPIDCYVINSDESRKFAYACGDFNPLHLDPVKARRYQFGSTLIHGINGTLRSLEKFFEDQPTPVRLSSLNVLFSKPVKQGAEITIFADRLNDSSARIEVYSEEKKVQTIDLCYSPATPHDCVIQAITIEHGSEPHPKEIDIADADSLKASVPLVWNPTLFNELFPHLATTIPSSQCATILATTNVVGMHCPGLNSVYARLSLTFKPENQAPLSSLGYSVDNVDERFSRVLIKVSNDTASGEIEAFFRPAPVCQPGFRELSSLVKKNQFSGQHALVIGGSRGIGELTAKLLAAGGARVTITFARGSIEAHSIARDISDNGGICEYRKFDLLEKDQFENLLPKDDKITHVYYMASPRIEKNTSSVWDGALFLSYADFYLNGLAEVVACFKNDPRYRNEKLNVFIPSTVFLEQAEKGFGEYIAAKAAAEALAGQLGLMCPNWRFYTPRLPRMLTDQTSGISGLDSLDGARTIMTYLDEPTL